MTIHLDLEDWQKVKQSLLQSSMREGAISINLQVPKNKVFDRIYQSIDRQITDRYNYGKGFSAKKAGAK